jgi:UDP-N-acetylmuramoyl-L-alanyl-D-glutamate--2,6-diaminopimelate ligase
MGEVAQRLADHIILTDDNPRSEDPQQIVAEILSGISDRQCVHVEHDRAKAIHVSIAASSANDLVLVAGKGHEDYQETAGRRESFSDIERVQTMLAGDAA